MKKLMKLNNAAIMSLGLLIIFALAGCDESSDAPTSNWNPTTGDITGEWIVTLSLNGMPGQDGVVWELTQTGGSFTITTNPGTSTQAVMPGVGTLNGSAFSYVETAGTSTISMTGTVWSDDAISGPLLLTFDDGINPPFSFAGNWSAVRATPPAYYIDGAAWTFEYGTSVNFTLTAEQGESAFIASATDIPTGESISIAGAVQDDQVDGLLEELPTGRQLRITGTITDANTMSGTWEDADNIISTGTWSAYR